MAANADSLPEPFFRLLRVNRSFVNEGSGRAAYLDFCSAYCVSAYLRSVYKPSVSPKEWAKAHPAPLPPIPGEPSALRGPMPAPPPEISESNTTPGADSCPGEAEGPHEPGLFPPEEESNVL